MFSKKCLRNHPQFLLHFLIHIDVLTCMLCGKFELILAKTFQVTAILENYPISEKYPCFFPKNGSDITPIFITFSNTY